MRISDWSSDVCSSDLSRRLAARSPSRGPTGPRRREDRGMILLTDELRQTLRTNAIIREMHAQREWPEPDPCPVVKFFNPLGAATWLATELGSDGDTLFGLADLGLDRKSTRLNSSH